MRERTSHPGPDLREWVRLRREQLEHGTLNEQVAAELRAMAARRRLKQTELAVIMGEQQPWISKKMNGAVPITLDELERFAQALNVSVVDLLPTGTRGVTSAFPPAPRTSPIIDTSVTHPAGSRPPGRSVVGVGSTGPGRPGRLAA